MSSEEEDDEIAENSIDDFPFVDAALENGFNFVRAVDECNGNYNEFLHRNSYISVRGATANPVEEDLILEYLPDIDGIVIEWQKLSGISQRISHLQIIPPPNISLKYMYSVIRKHVNLEDFNSVSLDLLRNCVASQLFYCEGWETWMGFIPKNNSTVAYSKEIIRKLSLKMLYDVKSQMETRLKAMRASQCAKNTLLKNNLNDLTRMFILPNDQDIVLQAFQSSIDGTDQLLTDFRTMIITFRFGDKCHTEVPLPISDYQAVHSVSIHVGLEIGACFPKANTNEQVAWDLFWCREGAQLLVGARGTCCKAMSFTECINYQSNLDGRRLDIDPKLAAVSHFPECMRFMQLYSDIPHRYPKCRMHPVSAAIIIPTCVYRNRSTVDKDARTYISETENNFSNLQGCRCRLEFVISPPNVRSPVRASDHIDMDNVRNLLHEYPLLAPFRHPLFCEHLRGIGLHLVGELASLFDTFKGTGESNAVWKAYQYELAIEKLLWGRPLCSKSRIYSINLGPGVEYASRSQTDSLGYLSLVEYTSCCEDELTTPPLTVYSGSDCVRRQISNLFGIFDLMGGSIISLGRRLVLLLLKELHQIGHVLCSFADFLLFCKARDCTKSVYRVAGATTVKQLIDILLSANKAKYPMVFVSVLKMLLTKQVDVFKAIQEGIHDLNLTHFPAIRLHDRNKNPGISWIWHQGLWILTTPTKASGKNDCLAQAIYFTPLVVREMENRKLCHGSTLANRLLPWIKPTLLKLRDLQLSEEQLVLELTFVTSIALLMDGKFVDFNRLNTLEGVLPVNQRKLQTLEILSRFVMNNFNKFRLWRLHASLPFKMAENTSSGSTKERQIEEEPIDLQPTTEEPLPPMVIEEICDEAEPRPLQFAPTRHLPANFNGRWSTAEVSVVGLIVEKYSDYRLKDQYDIYKRECEALHIPDRCFKAFLNKIQRWK